VTGPLITQVLGFVKKGDEWGTNAVFDDTCGNLIGLHRG
jgi:hypothetical protein